MLDIVVEGVAVADAFEREPRGERDDLGKARVRDPEPILMSSARNEPSASAASWAG